MEEKGGPGSGPKKGSGRGTVTTTKKPLFESETITGGKPPRHVSKIERGQRMQSSGLFSSTSQRQVAQSKKPHGKSVLDSIQLRSRQVVEVDTLNNPKLVTRFTEQREFWERVMREKKKAGR